MVAPRARSASSRTCKACTHVLSSCRERKLMLCFCTRIIKNNRLLISVVKASPINISSYLLFFYLRAKKQNITLTNLLSYFFIRDLSFSLSNIG
uniref:Uncharacterized protein n=1 Tax=Arundo donax TaxID=35708 RepID=A0A0A9G7W8_ARUDO